MRFSHHCITLVYSKYVHHIFSLKHLVARIVFYLNGLLLIKRAILLFIRKVKVNLVTKVVTA
jgi:hypothetical protein